LNGDGFAESRLDGAWLLDDGDDGGGFADADDTARLSGIFDNVANSEGVGVDHKKVMDEC